MLNRINYNWQWLFLILVIGGLIGLFYLGQYKYFAPADSSTLTLENTLLTVRAHKEANIIVLGDSTASVEVRTNLLNERLDRGKAINLGMPGSWLYSHYLLQKRVKRSNPGVDTVILFLGPDEFTNNGNTRLYADLQYHKTRLSIWDSPALLSMSDSWESQKTNLLAMGLRPVLYKTDLRDLVAHPVKRTKDLLRNSVWLNRKITSSDPLWEDERDWNVCELGPLEQLEQKLAQATAKGDEETVKKYKMNVAAYIGRRGEKKIDDSTEKNLTYLIGKLAGNFDSVYVVNAPIYQQFGEVYPQEYLAQIALLSQRIAERFDNTEYILLDQEITTDCTNFMDVVHLNLQGGTKLTEYLASYLNRLE